MATQSPVPEWGGLGGMPSMARGLTGSVGGLSWVTPRVCTHASWLLAGPLKLSQATTPSL